MEVAFPDYGISSVWLLGGMKPGIESLGNSVFGGFFSGRPALRVRGLASAAPTLLPRPNCEELPVQKGIPCASWGFQP